jgi:adenine-specific DNA methylase
LDSVHEKSVNHGHISTMHIWPARRPLAACRAALIATLLPDPGSEEERADLKKKIGGEITEKTTRSGNVKKATDGGVLHWKKESSPVMDEIRERIRDAFDGRPPKVLDPFAGGGAIPLEGMRLGCNTTAVDISPVAWFILKCTLDYPQKIAGEHRPLPDFALKNADFMDTYLKKATDLTRTKRER